MLQALAVAYLNAPIDGGYRLTFECLPRELNVRADYLSLVSALRHCDYRLRAELFHALDAWWGPHSIDRFAMADNRHQRGRLAGVPSPSGDAADGAFRRGARRLKHATRGPARPTFRSGEIPSPCACNAAGPAPRRAQPRDVCRARGSRL